MTFPGFEHVFGLHDPLASRPYRGCFEPHEAAVDLSRAESVEQPTVRVMWAMGAADPSLIVWTTSAHPLVVHETVIDVLRSQRFTGWATYRVEVYTKSEHAVEGYYGLAITGRCNRVDLSQSAIVLQKMPGGWVPRFQGHYFERESWDGTDLFMERPDERGNRSTWRFATEPVHRAFRRARIRNLDFCRLTEESVDTANYTIGLKYLLPPDYESRVQSAYQSAGVPRPAWV